MDKSDLLNAGLPDMGLVALAVDGVHFASHPCVVAVGKTIG